MEPETLVEYVQIGNLPGDQVSKYIAEAAGKFIKRCLPFIITVSPDGDGLFLVQSGPPQD